MANTEDYCIDADDYIILVRTDSHPSERHLVYRDDAVGLDDARKCKDRLVKKYPRLLVEIFHCPERGVRHLVF